MTEITYGAHEMDGVDFVDLSDEITVIIAATMGRYLVDLLPIRALRSESPYLNLLELIDEFQ